MIQTKAFWFILIGIGLSGAPALRAQQQDQQPKSE
jgi:hypothetical protein